MQIYELHFNPKAREDKVFDSFIHEPQSAYEKNLGSLYMAGEVNSSSQGSRVLIETAEAIKNRFYNVSFKNHNKALTESLKAGNEFLDNELKKENSGWLGNFNFAVLSVKDKNLSFSLSGDIKILLLRGGEISDIGKDLNALEIEPYPLKIFFNFLTGKLLDNDVLLVLTKDMYEFFEEHEILEKIAKTKDIDEKKIKTMLPASFFETNKTGASGVCILAIVKEDENSNPYLNIAKKAKEMIFQDKKEKSLVKVFSGLFPKREKIAVKAKKTKTISAEIVKKYSRNSDMPRTAILITAFIIVLFAGFLVFRNTEQNTITGENAKLNDFKQRISVADSLISANEDKKANELLKGILSEVVISEKNNELVLKDANELKANIEAKLLNINKQDKIDNPTVLTEINSNEIGFFPQNLTYFKGMLYLTSPLSEKLYEFNLTNKDKKGSNVKKSISLIDGESQSVLIFSPPSTMISTSEEFELKKPKEEFNFDSIGSYLMNIYFLDKSRGRVIKYPYISKFKWPDPQDALTLEVKPKAMAIDGFLWILGDDNTLSGYYKGNKEKSFNLDIYPDIKSITGIKTKAEVPYIYLAEPFNNRIIVIDKNGAIKKQFYSEKFNNIKDFAISYDGKTVWILNDELVYQVNLAI